MLFQMCGLVFKLILVIFWKKKNFFNELIKLNDCYRTGEQLFIMLNNESRLSWTKLNNSQKGKYQKAVLTIKRKYLTDYKKYLEQLPSEKLFEHYKNCIWCKYILFNNNKIFLTHSFLSLVKGWPWAKTIVTVGDNQE